MPRKATPSERALRARLAAHIRWKNTEDPAAATAPARAALMDKFEREVDPDGTLAPQERARRAQHARKAYFTRLALKSVQARRKSAAYVAETVKASIELAVLDAQDGGDDDAAA